MQADTSSHQPHSHAAHPATKDLHYLYKTKVLCFCVPADVFVAFTHLHVSVTNLNARRSVQERRSIVLIHEEREPFKQLSSRLVLQENVLAASQHS